MIEMETMWYDYGLGRGDSINFVKMERTMI